MLLDSANVKTETNCNVAGSTFSIKARTDRKLSEKKAKAKKSTGRIEETVQNMKIYKDDVAKVAKVMNISPETVKRNMRKAKAKG